MKAAILSIATAALLRAATLERPAHACGASCPVEVLGPARGQSVPGNVPALPVSDLCGRPPDPSSISRNVVLLDGVGAVVPTDEVRVPEGLFLKARVPLLAGAYELRSTVRRLDGTVADVVTSNRFETLPPAQLPAEAGALTAEPSRFEPSWRVWDNGGGCSLEPPAVVVRFSLTPSAELVPFLPVAKLSLRVDGELWAETTYDGRKPIADLNRTVTRGALEVHTVCGLAPGAKRLPTDTGLSPGSHRASLEVTIAGAAPLPALTVPFELSCPDSSPRDGGASNDGGSEGGTLRDAAAPSPAAGGATTAPAGTGSGGCSFDGGARPTSFLSLLAVLLAPLTIVARAEGRSRKDARARGSDVQPGATWTSASTP